MSSIPHAFSAFPGAAVMQNLHPLVVHFPIAFLSGSTLMYVAAWTARREAWAWPALWMLAIGVAGAAAAVWTGLRASAGVMIAPSVREHILRHHEHLMIMGAALSVLLLLWALLDRPLPSRGRLGFILAMLLMSGTLARGADYGGWMVFGYNAGGALPQPIDFTR
jgi:uncharacterized membrane protein